MELHQAVAGNIHRIRKSQRLSMDRAAELAGISVSMWGQVERGSVNPTLAVLGKIAAGLHVPLELLIENREEAPATLYRAVDVAGQRLYGGKVIRYPLFPFDTDSRSESCQMDIFISGVYESGGPRPRLSCVPDGAQRNGEGHLRRRSVPAGEPGLPLPAGAGGAAVCQRGQHHRAAAGVDSLP